MITLMMFAKNGSTTTYSSNSSKSMIKGTEIVARVFLANSLERFKGNQLLCSLSLDCIEYQSCS